MHETRQRGIARVFNKAKASEMPKFALKFPRCVVQIHFERTAISQILEMLDFPLRQKMLDEEPELFDLATLSLYLFALPAHLFFNLLEAHLDATEFHRFHYTRYPGRKANDGQPERDRVQSILHSSVTEPQDKVYD